MSLQERCLVGTANYTLTFRAGDQEETLGWADSSFHSEEGDRRNKYGYCFQLEKSLSMFIVVRRRSTLIAP